MIMKPQIRTMSWAMRMVANLSLRANTAGKYFGALLS